MSNELYKNKWQGAVNDLMEQVQLETMLEGELATSKRQPYEQFQFFAQLYIKYIDIYKKLEDCYDQMVHPQKRKILKDMLEHTMVRMCETKKALVQTNVHNDQYQCDFVNLDELIMDLKLTPDSLEIPVPRYFRKEEDFRRLDERNQIVDKLLVDFHDTNAPEEEIYQDKSISNINMDVLICLIQKNERGRQGIERALKAKFLRKQEVKKHEKSKKLAEGIEIAEETEREDAILIIQKYYRGYKGRFQVHFLREEELHFLGMKKQSEDPNNQNSQFSKQNEQREKIQMIQKDHQREYVKALDELKNLVKQNEGPEIKERKLKERNQWIEKYLDMTQNKKLPEKATDFYDKEKMYPLTQEELDAQGKGGKGKGAKKEEKKPSKSGKKGKGVQDSEVKKDVLLSMDTVMKLNQQIEEFSKGWGSINESENFAQKYVSEIAMNEKRPEVEKSLDDVVDELLEIELDNRHLFLFNKPRKKKKPRPPRPPKPKTKKVPGIILVKGRNPLDLLSELVEAGIVKKLLPAQLTDLIGEQNILGSVQERQFETMADPSMAQLRQVLSEYIAIPMGSKFVKEKVDKLNYFFFYGPQGTGKTLAVRALAYECNALLVDISPSTIEQQATDKNSVAKTLYMAFTVAKEFQPAIIYLDEAEQVFGAAKKKKGQPAANWTKLKKPLQDFKKQKYLEPTDRVVFIGCTNKPTYCGMKDTKNFFEKKFYFPYPNYGTRKQLFQYFVERTGIELPINFHVSTVAHLTEGYTAGSFKSVVNQVVTKKRIERLKEDPLKLSEFIAPLSKAYFTYQLEYENIRVSINYLYLFQQVFTDDVTGMKERREYQKMLANQDPTKKGSKKENKKGKK